MTNEERITALESKIEKLERILATSILMGMQQVCRIDGGKQAKDISDVAGYILGHLDLPDLKDD